MRRDSTDEVTRAVRSRLELLGRELGREPDRESGREPGREPDPGGPARSAEPTRRDPVAPAAPGRHSRRRPPPAADRGVAWLQDRLPATLQGRVSLGAGHVAVLAVLVAIALAVTAWLGLRSRPDPVATPAARTTPVAASAAAPATAGIQAAGVAPPAPGSPGTAAVVVDVAGKVRRPGVTTLPAGSRVVDAIRKAGGARRGVDLSSLNLARVLVDGEQILVGQGAAPGVAASAASQPGATAGALVNLNTATLADLDALPGVGPVTAQKILDWRTGHGRFTAIDELLEIDGIGEKTLAEMAARLTL